MKRTTECVTEPYWLTSDNQRLTNRITNSDFRPSICNQQCIYDLAKWGGMRGGVREVKRRSKGVKGRSKRRSMRGAKRGQGDEQVEVKRRSKGR